eukprot:3040824-Pleurochrysis_carterae.AAC.1
MPRVRTSVACVMYRGKGSNAERVVIRSELTGKGKGKTAWALEFQHPPLCSEPSKLLSGDIHDDVKKRKEQARRKRLREEVRQVVHAPDEGGSNFNGLDLFANEEVAAMNVHAGGVVDVLPELVE